MNIKPKNKRELVEAALGKRPCDLFIENAQIVNMFTGEIYKGAIGIYDGFIAHIQCDPDNKKKSEKQLIANNYYDANGKFLIPGLIDAHAHIESTMMTPRNLAHAVIPCGTTTMVTDPHEIANVCGIEGVLYMHECSMNLPMRQLILIPSCVPAVPGLENSAAVFSEKEITSLLNLDRVIGLAEVMDFMGVINNDDRMVNIIEAVDKKNMFIEGHAPNLSGKELSAYLCAGPNSDHESTTSDEAREKIRAGMFVDARESSITKNVEAIVNGVKNFRYYDNLTLCTDDREPEDIIRNGQMNDVVRKAIKCGMHPIDAIRSATLNVAREIGAKNLGAIAPGFVADMVLVDSLEELIPKAVFFQGKLVAEDRKLIDQIENMNFNLENINTVYVDGLKIEDFSIKAPVFEGKITTRIIKYCDFNSADTEFLIEELPVANGHLDISFDNDLKYVAVVNRHPGHNTVGHGIVRNFGTLFGAVGSTVSHDCHNLIIVYDTPENGYAAAKKIMETSGGISCAAEGKVIGNLALPIAGLMSKKPCEELAKEVDMMKSALRNLGLSQSENPLLRIATLALPVIPKAKMSDMGIVDVLEQKIVPLFL
ncbi:MAG: adenine deaminase [Sedimentibacter sp.]